MDGRKHLCLLAILGTAALSLAVPQAAAQEGRTPHRYSQQAMQQALRYVDELEVQGQRIMTEAMQVALDIHPEQSLARFQESHDFFVEVLQTLQTGDPELGLPEPSEPELIAQLEALQQVWDQLDATLAGVIQARSVSRTDVILLSEFDNILVDISRQVEAAYEHQFARTNLSSMAVATVVQAEHLVFLIERMQTEILLISYGHDVDEQRRQLAESAGIFGRTLEGLIAGDPANRLMPPPNAEIKSRLREVQRHWDEIAPTIERIANGGAADRATVIGIVDEMEPLYEEMEHSVDLYTPHASMRRSDVQPATTEPDEPPYS